MRTLVVTMLILLSASAFAQDPITGSAALGYLSTNGNTESTNANGQFKVVWDRDRPWIHEWTAMAIKASTSGTTTAEAKAAGYKARREITEESYFFASGDWREDRFSSYSKQVSEAFGYGRKLIDNDRQTLALEGGVGAKQSDLIDGTQLDEAIVRGLLDYVLHISESSEFSQKFLMEIGDENTYTESVSALKATVVGNLALVLSYTLKNNSDVLPGIEKTDSFTAISLEYGF
jgi:putative salt-induced outer membrane protein